MWGCGHAWVSGRLRRLKLIWEWVEDGPKQNDLALKALVEKNKKVESEGNYFQYKVVSHRRQYCKSDAVETTK